MPKSSRGRRSRSSRERVRAASAGAARLGASLGRRPAPHAARVSRALQPRLGAHDRGELVEGVLEPVVDDHVAELRLRRELLFGDLQAALDLLLVVGAAADQARAQRLERGRRDEHLHRLGHRLAHLACALDLDLQHHRHALADAAVELGAQRAVAAAGVVGVLDEVARGDPAVELLGAEEVVVDAVVLARARRRVVADTDSSSCGRRSISPLISVPLPTPEGPVMTNTRATGRESSGRRGGPRRARARRLSAGPAPMRHRQAGRTPASSASSRHFQWQSTSSKPQLAQPAELGLDVEQPVGGVLALERLLDRREEREVERARSARRRARGSRTTPPGTSSRERLAVELALALVLEVMDRQSQETTASKHPSAGSGRARSCSTSSKRLIARRSARAACASISSELSIPTPSRPGKRRRASSASSRPSPVPRSSTRRVPGGISSSSAAVALRETLAAAGPRQVVAARAPGRTTRSAHAPIIDAGGPLAPARPMPCGA